LRAGSEIRRFQRRDRPVEDAELIDLPAFESIVAEAKTESEVRLAPRIGNVLEQSIADDFDFSGHAIKVDAHAGGAAGTIICHGDMGPCVDGKRRFRDDLERIARPHVMQAEGDTAILQQQLVTATAGVNGCLAVMKHNEARRMRGRTQPQTQRERIDAREVTDAGEIETILAVQFDRLARLAGYEFRPLDAVSRFLRIGAISDLI